MIRIYKGDDTDFADLNTISITIDTELELAGFIGRFSFQGVAKDFTSAEIVTKTVQVVFSAEETSKFTFGQGFGVFTLVDPSGSKAAVQKVVVEVVPHMEAVGGESSSVVIKIENVYDYNKLANQPKIEGVKLVGDKSGSDLGLQSKLVSGESLKTINGESLLGSGDIEVGGGKIPKKLSDLEDDAEHRLVTDVILGNISANTTARHTHSNAAILDATTASFTAEQATAITEKITEPSGKAAGKALMVDTDGTTLKWGDVATKDGIKIGIDADPLIIADVGLVGDAIEYKPKVVGQGLCTFTVVSSSEYDSPYSYSVTSVKSSKVQITTTDGSIKLTLTGTEVKQTYVKIGSYCYLKSDGLDEEWIKCYVAKTVEAGTTTDSVSYSNDSSKGKTDDQKTQARNNIGAAAENPTFTPVETWTSVSSGSSTSILWGATSGDLTILKNNLESHTDNADIHVTTTDKANWNAKQSSLAWVTGHEYSVGNSVLVDGVIYACKVAHTSTTWDADKDSKWEAKCLPTTGGNLTGKLILAHASDPNERCVVFNNTTTPTSQYKSISDGTGKLVVTIPDGQYVEFKAKASDGWIVTSNLIPDDSRIATLKKALPSGAEDYDDDTTYSLGQTCWYESYIWMATKETKGIVPSASADEWKKITDPAELLSSALLGKSYSFNVGSNILKCMCYALKNALTSLGGTVVGMPDLGEYLTFTANTAGSTVTFTWRSGSDVKYRYNKGEWQEYTKGATLTLSAIGDTIQFKGKNVCTGYTSGGVKKFFLDGSIAASGSVTSLTDEFGFYTDVELQNSCYYAMFANCSALTSAPMLVAKNLTQTCYYQMFANCTGLTATPTLYATSMVAGCYEDMFTGCTNLKKVTTYQDSFTGCTNWLPSNEGEFHCTGTLKTVIDAIPEASRGASNVPTTWTVEDDVA